MKRSKSAIPYYTEINDILEAIPWQGRTTNPMFYCLRFKKLNHDVKIYHPPFKRGFYYFSLYLNSGKIKIEYGDKAVQDPESFLVCQSPGLTYSYSGGNSLEGYLVYFKSECFSFFKPDFHKEFPFFNILYTNLLTLDRGTYQKLAPHFEEVFSTYEQNNEELHMEARVKLLALFYHIKKVMNERFKATRFSTKQALLNKYIRLVNNHYIEKRTVKEYADLLSVTPNYLSQLIKNATGKNAYSFISERLLSEAKSFILYTDFGISEIAYRLGFSDPSNFGRFFKKHTGISPSAYRKQRNQ